ncbi:sensor histidine kinase [Nocardioides sp.]|uniref:sensor histidine kinase n=1 Tax=Nocardioides sp. TaxID=35761 RepID=UPI00271E0A9F|nr:sensor histidine kinase [Nocardioides sp.]MDO9456969.1 sensor domain-containing protein [Nocardioides sp.]
MTEPSRARLTGYAAAQLLLGVVALVLFVLTVTGAALMVVWVGGLLLAISLPLTRLVADAHRHMAAGVLGLEVPRPYRPVPRHPWHALVAVARDPMSYRDLAWTVWACTFGWVVALICVLELLAVVTWPLWWWTLRPKMRARSQIDLWFLATSRTEKLEQRVQVLTETRADVVDTAAAELRRLERDLHDGPQARLVALSMSLGLAEQRLSQEGWAEDPEGARRLVSDARSTTSAAISDLRSVVRGIHPPVLADRGLAGAVQALALDMAVPVTVTAELDGRPPAPVESALYFAVAECLANVGKHAHAESATIVLTHDGGRVRVRVVDDGVGGAHVDAGTGMLGVRRRLAAFDGTMSVSSPSGGPTEITLEVPCDLSSPRTTPSSGPG